jgi:adenosylhomocysteine nucleosidase
MRQPIAVLAAMEQELRLIEDRLHQPTEQQAGGRRFVSGTLAGVGVVTAISGYGKVGAAATVTTALDAFAPSHVVFGGVAGGIGEGVEIGDVVVADRLIQHDFDASPIFDRFVVPSLGVAEVTADPELTDILVGAASAYVSGAFREEMARQGMLPFEAGDTAIHVGLLASGDQFIDHVAQARALLSDLPHLLAVEMEGAAVAQVCAERSIPFAVFRSISDRADQNADVDFLAFIATVAAPITAGIVDELMQRLD